MKAPFAHVLAHVKPERDKNRRDAYRKNWWRHVEARPAMWATIQKLAAASLLPRAERVARRSRVWCRAPAADPHPTPLRGATFSRPAGEGARFIATVRHSKFRGFVWFESTIVPDSALIAITRDDDTTFGVLHSRFHEAWALRMGTWLGVGNDPRYTPTTSFETFPFPENLTPNIPATNYADDPRAQRIAEAAKRLDELRRDWLNPRRSRRERPRGRRRLSRPYSTEGCEAAATLKERTLTNLYNQRPQWLADTHDALDRAVAAAYGWPEDIPTDEALAKLLELNLARAGG